MTDPKQKAQEIFFLHWFDTYSKLSNISRMKALDEVDKKIISDYTNSTYWQEVKKHLLTFV